jgi:hypothetical protein
MGLLDIIADRSFRDDPAGRVVVFGGGFGKRGYLVKSKAEELKIRSFLKMFGFAELSIQWLGTVLAILWMDTFRHGSDRLADQMLRTICIYLGTYALVAGLPLLLLWRSSKKEFLRFVSPEDEVLVTSKPSRNGRVFPMVALVAIGALILVVVVLFLLVRAK